MQLQQLLELKNLILMGIIMVLLVLSVWFIFKNTHTDANNPLMTPDVKNIVVALTGIAVAVALIIALIFSLKAKI